MAIGLGPDLGLVSIILFLLPGFAGIKIGLRIAERGDWLNRLETVALSFALSLASMFILYVLWSIQLSILLGELALLSATRVDPWSASLPSAISIYLLIVLVSVFVGAGLGLIDFGGNYFEPTLPWARFHQLAKLSGEGETYAVRVRTMAGDELRGKVEEEGEAALNKDIILEDPLRIRFSDEGAMADRRSWTGNAYIHSQSIAHVEFDRLEDADAIEAAEYERKSQQMLDETSDTDEDEMEELEELVEESEQEGDVDEN